MTAPDVAALAAALRPVTRGTWSSPTRRDPERQRKQDERWLVDTAEAIIAALAERGWRITDSPSWTDKYVGESDANWQARQSQHADDPVSAQAAPEGWTDGRSVLAAYENDVRDIEQVAVRAALVGLLADVTIERSKTSIRDGSTSGRFVVDWLAVIALIKARLEALDADRATGS